MSAGHDSAGLGEADLSGYRAWVEDSDSGPSERDPASADPTDSLLEHPAVFYHGRGVMSEHLADFIDRMAERTMDRVLGVGHDQYQDENGQVFESHTIDRQYEELLDELADAIAYIAFIAIKAGVVLRNTPKESHA